MALFSRKHLNNSPLEIDELFLKACEISPITIGLNIVQNGPMNSPLIYKNGNCYDIFQQEESK